MEPDNSGPLNKKLAKLRAVAETRFRQRQSRLAAGKRQKKGNVPDAKLSSLGRAARRLESCKDKLACEVKERCAIQRAVAREYKFPEMLSKDELDRLEEQMMTSAQQAVVALQQSNLNDFSATGDVSPLAVQAAQERVQFHVPVEVRSVVNTELAVLRAEGEAQPERPSKLKPSSAARRNAPAKGSHHKFYKTALGRNIDRFRKECGWTFDRLAEKSGIDKKLILGHVNKGKGAYPKTLRTYADAFSRELKRDVTVAELERRTP